MKLAWVAAVTVSLASAQDSGQKAPDAPEPVKTVVTVTARPAAVETTGGDVTVIIPATTPAASPHSLAELLRFQPALYVGQAGQRGGLTAISLRGGDPNFTLVMMDGIPVNDITDQLGGTVDLSTIIPFNVARVEVVRGPMSAIYGSEAVAGVVNLVTEDQVKQPWTVRLETGNFGAFEGRMVTGGRRGRLLYSLGIAGTHIGEQVERDSFDAIDSGGRAGVAIGKSTWVTLSFRGRHAEAAGFPANSGGPKYALDRALETRDTTSGLGAIEWKHATERWSHVAELDVFNQDQDQNSPAIFDQLPPSSQTIPATNSDTTFRRTRVNASTSARLAHGWTATVGAAYRRETGENLGSIAGFGPAAYRLTRNAKALFAETVLDRRKWSVVAGIRSDWVSGGFERLSPRVGASVALPWSGARLRSSWGNGFKMPSFYALAQPFVGNPRLRPETSTAFDIGIEQKLGQRFGVIAGNLFRSAYRDLVDFSPELFRLVNRSEALARGGDVSWRLALRTGVMIQAHATFSAIHLKDSAEPVRDRPRWRTGATLSIPIWSHTDLYAEGLFVASRFDFQLPVPQLNRAPSYFVANLAARRQIRQRFSAFARLDNVLNRKYDEYVGFRNPGIQVRAGFDYSFR